VDRLILSGFALALAILAFLPIANWIPGGHAAPWYGAVATDFLPGLAIVAGVGIVFAILSRRMSVLWRSGATQPIEKAVLRHPALFTFAAASAAFALYCAVARLVLSGRPLLIDEVIQVFQARILASGRLWLPVSAHPEFFSMLHLVDSGGKLYGQFPFGGPGMLALGSLAGAEWLVGPVFGAISVCLWAGLLRRVEPRPLIVLGAILLFAFAPFTAFMAGSHMNHVTSLTWVLLGMLGLAAAADPAGGRWRDGFLCGFGFGVAATIRPVDAVAFALPAGLWLLWRAGRTRRLAALIGAGVGIALPIGALLFINRETTGAPLLFGYSVLWGGAQGLGFHATPWGMAHTPARGVELLNLYFLQLQSYLFELPIPSLLPATIALALTRRVSPFDRYLLVSCALLCGFYFAYWHDGFYLGPRYLYPLLPALALWSVRGVAEIRIALGQGAPYRATVGALIAACVLGVATAVPLRVRQYRSQMLTFRWDADAAAKRANVRDALVFVRESWGAELVARMWALGVSRPDGEAIYRAADPCRLDLALDGIERSEVRGPGATAELRPLRADSARLVAAQNVTGDPWLRLTPNTRYPPYCLAKIEANRSGFTAYAPLLLARRFGNTYARDLGARDSLLVREAPDRPLFLLRPIGGGVGEVPVFLPLKRDSLIAAWRSKTGAPTP
jgi:hypothetical protein